MDHVADDRDRELSRRVEEMRLRLQEAEAALDLHRREVELLRHIALDHDVALALQEEERQQLEIWEQEEGEDHAAEHTPQARENTDERTCTSCLESFNYHDTFRSACGHDWCQTCVVDRFERAAKSAYLFPAECCQQPILPENDTRISPELWARYLEKKTEVETPNPTYCSKRECSKFVPRQNINEGQAECTCGHLTCVGCKTEWHSGECVVDPETDQILRISEEKQWQRCVHCRALIDRRDGCNEMECSNCGVIFCYACGKEWKTCPCSQFGPPQPETSHDEDDDGRQIGRPDWGVEPVEIVEPDETTEPDDDSFESPMPDGLTESDDADAIDEETIEDGWQAGLMRAMRRVEDRQNELWREPVRLRGAWMTTDPESHAHNWRRIRGGQACQSCHTFMSNFLFECTDCQTISCLRCRRNEDEAS